MTDSPKAESKPHPPTPESVEFDLDYTLSAVVGMRARVPEDAMTAPLLGTEREGHGVVIGEHGLTLTIGYLIAEAEVLWLIDAGGRAVAGDVVAYDYETGFGLAQALQPLAAPALELGSSAGLEIGERIIVAAAGGREQAIDARIVGKQPFAGYWEYLLDEALYTSPAHHSWGGAALLGCDGTVRGIGSLMVQERQEKHTRNMNLFVPIDLLKPILDDLLHFGRARRPPRPWLGLLATEYSGLLAVIQVIEAGPADRAGIRTGDIILEVAGEPVEDLPGLFRTVWSLGEAGVNVPLTIARDGGERVLQICSGDRYSYQKSPHLH